MYSQQNHCIETSLHEFQWQHYQKVRRMSSVLPKANEVPASALPLTSRAVTLGWSCDPPETPISSDMEQHNNTCSTHLGRIITRQQNQSAIGERICQPVRRCGEYKQWPGHITSLAPLSASRRGGWEEVRGSPNSPVERHVFRSGTSIFAWYSQSGAKNRFHILCLHNKGPKPALENEWLSWWWWLTAKFSFLLV